MKLALPGATLGMLGGGQLARMTAIAARQLGLQVAILDPDASCAAAPLADRVVVGTFDDPAAAAQLARGCAAVTWDTEKVTEEAAAAAAGHAPVYPGPELLSLVGDRIAQKTWLAGHGFPLPAWRGARTAAELDRARAELGRCRAKSARGGYDGRGQLKLDARSSSAEVIDALGTVAVEEELSLQLELSVLIARGVDGAVQTYPVARNWHSEGILVRTLLPAGLDPALERRALELGSSLAAQLGLVGLLTVELFVDSAGRLLVNEIAARTHNTFHATVEACTTSQFEQLVRAVCGLPLGSTRLRTQAVLMNLLGDEWLRPEPPDVSAALALPGVSLHLYGKEPRLNRKVGHLVVSGPDDPAGLLARADEAISRLRRQRPPG